MEEKAMLAPCELGRKEKGQEGEGALCSAAPHTGSAVRCCVEMPWTFESPPYISSTPFRQGMHPSSAEAALASP